MKSLHLLFRARALLAVALATVIAAAAGACGGSRGGVIPTLPGGGDTPGAAAATTAPPAARDPWAGRDDLITAPAPARPDAIALPPVHRFTLPNGLDVIVVERKDLPVVDVRLAIGAGRLDAPRDRMGLARFTGSMLVKGTRTRDARAIAQRIDQVGGSLRVDTSLEATSISCKVLSRSMDTCLTLVSDLAIRPTFPAEEMDRVRQGLLASVRARQDDVAQLATAHFHNLLWGDEHVRGWPMSARTLDAIERKHLQSWHERRFLPNNAILAVAGDVDAGALRARLARAFRPWRRGKVPARAAYAPPALQGIRVRLIDEPGQTQTHIRLGHPGIAHRDPDFFDMVVLDHVLGGGGSSSRLMQVVRAEAGETAAAASTLEQSRERGAFMVSVFTRNAEALATVRLVLEELARVREQGPTAAEVGDAITHIAGSYVTSFQAAADFGSALLAARFHELGDDYVRDYPLRVAGVTPASARAAAAARLNAEDLVLVLAGDARELEPQLARARIPYQRVGHLEPIAAYERGPAAAVPASAEARAAGKALLARALAAKGGAARLARVGSVTLRADATISTGGQSLPATLTRRFQKPDELRLDVELRIPGGSAGVVTIVAGDQGWSRQPPPVGVVELPPDAVAALQEQIWREPELILLRATREPGVEAVSLGVRTFEGGAYDALRITRGGGQVSAVLYLDRKTHLVRAMTYEEQGRETVERYDDYRAVSGMQVSYRRQTQSVDALLDVTVTSVAFDQALAPALFERPEPRP